MIDRWVEIHKISELVYSRTGPNLEFTSFFFFCVSVLCVPQVLIVLNLACSVHITHKYTAYQVVLVVKNLPSNAGDTRDAGSITGLGRSPERRKRATTTVFLPKKFHGQRSLAGYRQQSDTTERLNTHTHKYRNSIWKSTVLLSKDTFLLLHTGSW